VREKILNKKSITIFLIMYISILIFSWEVPKHYSNTNDYLNILKEDQKIENLIKDIRSNKGIEIAVVTLSVQDEITPKEMATEIFNSWKIGDKEKDNGLLILIALSEEKGKSRIEIETGYGLEGDFPDGKVGRLIDTYMMENLSKKNYDLAVINVLEAINDYISGDIDLEESSDDFNPIFLVFIIMGTFIIIVLIAIFTTPKCSSCGKRMKMSQKRVIKRATRYSAGQGLYVYKCPNCGNIYRKTYIIPRIGSSSGGFGGGSGSSSGGSSFGGGSSGGGGAGRSF
jgi:uncharacterized protein